MNAVSFMRYFRTADMPLLAQIDGDLSYDDIDAYVAEYLSSSLPPRFYKSLLFLQALKNVTIKDIRSVESLMCNRSAGQK